MRSIGGTFCAGVGGCSVRKSAIAVGVKGIVTRRMGTKTFSKNHLISELDCFFKKFGLLFGFSGFIFFNLSLHFLRYLDFLCSGAIVNLASQINC